ncbi:partial Aerobic respiration control sensor protein ArcB, partial [Rhodocyclaceae bacterium]
RLLGNLVGNAIKYTERGGVLVGIRRRGDRALVQVWDTGVGIAPEHRDVIFDEYFQIGNPERNRTKGLGLGLAIAKRVARLLDTDVVCRSRPGRGSVFEFSLPLAAPAELALVAPAGAAGDVLTLVDSRKVVLVEDNPLVAEATRVVLESVGMHVTVHAGAGDALADPAIAEADVYVSDLSLPGLNGVELLDAIQGRVQKPIKAVLLTGDTAPGQVAAFRASRWTVLYKPVSLPQLLAAIREQEAGS